MKKRHVEMPMGCKQHFCLLNSKCNKMPTMPGSVHVAKWFCKHCLNQGQPQQRNMHTNLAVNTFCLHAVFLGSDCGDVLGSALWRLCPRFGVSGLFCFATLKVQLDHNKTENLLTAQDRQAKISTEDGILRFNGETVPFARPQTSRDWRTNCNVGSPSRQSEGPFFNSSESTHVHTRKCLSRLRVPAHLRLLNTLKIPCPHYVCRRT